MTTTDDANDDAQSAVPAVDQDLAKRVVQLYQDVDEALTEMDVSPEERKQIEQQLMEAIAADLLTRLGVQMSDKDKEELTSLAEEPGGQPDLGKVAEFFKGKFTQADLVQALAAATESVLVEFTSAMGGKEPL